MIYKAFFFSRKYLSSNSFKNYIMLHIYITMNSTINSFVSQTYQFRKHKTNLLFSAVGLVQNKTTKKHLHAHVVSSIKILFTRVIFNYYSHVSNSLPINWLLMIPPTIHLYYMVETTFQNYICK